MKKSFYLFCFSILFVILFASCKIQGPSMCSVTVITSEHGTASVDSDSAILGNFVTVHVFPDEGYYCSEIDASYYVKDEELENTYHVLVSESNMAIHVEFYQKAEHFVSTQLKKCTLSFEGYGDSSNVKAYKDKKVTFTVKPVTNYTVDVNTVKVKYSDDVISVTQDESDPNKFSFIMPDSDVTVYVDCVFALFVTPEKKTYQKGDKVIFNIENNTTLTKGDLYYRFAREIDNNYINIISVKEFQKDFDLTAKTFEYLADKSGEITFYLEQDSKYIPLCNIEVRFPGLPDDTLPLYFELVKDEEVDNTGWSNPTLERKLSFSTGYSKNTLYYYYKDDPENVFLANNISMYYANFEFVKEYCYDVPRTIVFYLTGKISDGKDNERTYKSEEIEFEMKKYEKVYKKNTADIFSTNSGFGDWSEKPKFSSGEYYVELDTETNAAEYFSAKIDGEFICLESIEKTTAIPRLLKLYKNGTNSPTDDILFAEIWVTIPFKGVPEYTINKIKN